MLDIWKLVQGSDFQTTELSKFVEVQIQVYCIIPIPHTNHIHMYVFAAIFFFYQT